MSITSCLVGRVHEICPSGVGHFQVARISGNEVVRFFGTDTSGWNAAVAKLA